MKKSWFIALAVCALTLLLLTPVAYRKWGLPQFRGASLAKNTVRTAERPPAYVRSLRPEYPYSVIPGGAYSPEELRRANVKDDVVRAHYADFDLKAAWVVKLTADRYEYASYRMQNQIYWTARKLRIPQGEALLTDGVHFARARCGNRLSEVPHAEISSVEPPASLLSPAEFRPGLASNLELGAPAPLSVEMQTPLDASPELASPETPTNVALAQSEDLPGWPGTASSFAGGVPSSFLPPGAGIAGLPSRPLRGTPSQPPDNFPPEGPPAPPVVPSPVPEPSSIYLFLITFAAVLWALARVMAAEEKRQPDEAQPSFSDDLD
jgi:hypothetical protein